jgi:hypothetical protein
MAGFNGKWKLKDVKNAEAYYNAINSPEDYKVKLRAIAEAVKADSNAYIEEITVNTAAGTVNRIVWIDGEKKRDTGDLKTGAELEHPSADGRPAKVKVTIDSDTKITRVETGEGFTTTTVFELNGNTLTATSTGNGQTTTSTYERA